MELAKRVNEYQGRMRAVTRKFMAIVSELSMYQATSLKLGAEKDDLEATVRREDHERFIRDSILAPGHVFVLCLRIRILI